jgi:hypothetical protein
LNSRKISTGKLVRLWQLREWHKTPPQSPPVPLYFKSKPHTPSMEFDTSFDPLWDEIEDMPGEIFDVEIKEDLDQSFESKLNSKFDF